MWLDFHNIYCMAKERKSHCTEIIIQKRGMLGRLPSANTRVHFPVDTYYSLPPTDGFAFTAFYFQSALALSSQAVCVLSSCLAIPPVILLNHS